MDEDKLPAPIDARFLPPENQELLTDLDYVRKNQIDLIETSIRAITSLLDVAERSQHPRAYEVVAHLLKTSSELQGALINIAEKKKLNKDVGTPESGQIVNNNLFIGTTADLQDLLDKLDEKRASKE